MSIVHCRLPHSGLGNQLFPLMKAHIFGEINRIPVLVTNYRQLKIGPWLRREKTKRNYSNYFTFQRSIVGAWLEQRKVKATRWKQTIAEPPLKVLGQEEKHEAVYQFTSIPHYHDFFEGLKAYRERTKTLLQELLRDDIKAAVAAAKAPVIGVHIRMGDFRKLAAGEDFSKAGSTRTPEEYFIDCIERIRTIHGSSLPVSIFTDGYRHELEQLLSLENVSMVEGNRDIVDLLLLSRSQVIVTSAGSTFSYWSGFLADAPVIMHPDHIYQPLRPAYLNERFYEGPLNGATGGTLLERNIRSISV